MSKKPLYMQRRGASLEARTVSDLELLEAHPEGVDLEVNIKRRRSHPQLKKYWAGLSRIVKATEKWPTAKHLHDAIKLELGYVTPVYKFNGTRIYMPDSIALDEMDQAEFNEFFERATKLLIETFGIDPTRMDDAA